MVSKRRTFKNRSSVFITAKKGRILVEENSKLIGYSIIFLLPILMFLLLPENVRLIVTASLLGIVICTHYGGDYGIIKRVICFISGIKRTQRGGYRGKYRFISPVLVFAIVAGLLIAMISLGISIKSVIVMGVDEVVVSICEVSDAIKSSTMFWVIWYFLTVVALLLLCDYFESKG